MIITAEYMSGDNNVVKATYDTGEVWFLPLPNETHRKADLDEFLNGGGVIAPYVPQVQADAPAPGPTIADLAARIADLEAKQVVAP